MNGRWPVANSYNTTPSENTSVADVTVSPRACSGDMYRTVPNGTPGVVSSGVTAFDRKAGVSSKRARPKSSSFT